MKLPFYSRLYGLPDGASNDTYYFGGSVTGRKFNGERTTNIINVNFNVAIVIKHNVTCENLIFKPMLIPETITDTTFESYALGNRDLTTWIEKLNLRCNFKLPDNIEYPGYNTSGYFQYNWTCHDGTLRYLRFRHINGNPQLSLFIIARYNIEVIEVLGPSTNDRYTDYEAKNLCHIDGGVSYELSYEITEEGYFIIKTYLWSPFFIFGIVNGGDFIDVIEPQ